MGYALGILDKKEVYWGDELGTERNSWAALLKESLRSPSEGDSGVTLVVDYALGPHETKEIRLLLGWFYPLLNEVKEPRKEGTKQVEKTR